MEISQSSPRSKSFLLASALVVACLVLTAGKSVGQVADPELVPGRLLVKSRVPLKATAWHSLLSAHGAKEVGAIDRIGVRVVRVSPRHWANVLHALQRHPAIQFVEPDRLFAPAQVPNDPYYPFAWHLPKIGAPAAWDITTGSSNVTIAILDSGVESSHPDLMPLLIPGWNFYDNNADTRDVTGHGTGVAGAAAAAGNNAAGVTGVSWGCRIIALRISDTNGYGNTTAIATALTWAADQGVRVANLSFRASGSPTVQAAAQYFQSQGGVVTISAGNESVFDATADNPYALTVSGTEASDALWVSSNTGNNVDLAAPASAIVTTSTGGNYGSGTGTSFSSALVAGVAALVLSANPALSGSQVQQILMNSVDDLGAPGWDTSFGWGRVNALKAVQAAVNASTGDTVPPTAVITAPNAGATVSGVAIVNVTASDNVGVTNVSLFVNDVLTGSTAAAPASFAWDTSAFPDGPYNLQARAYDAAGNVGTSSVVTVSIQNTPSDTTAPVASFLNVTGGATLSGITDVTVDAFDDTGVTQVALYANGGLLGTGTTVPATFPWDTTSFSNGSFTLLAVATDAAGNSGSAQVIVQVNNADFTPPIVQITSPSSGITVGKTTKVTVAASDNQGVTRVELRVDGKLYATSSSSNPTFTWYTSKLRPGSHYLQARAFDAAGNNTRSTTLTVYK